MNSFRPLWILLLCASLSAAQTSFDKPSEAYAFAYRDVTAWNAALRAGKTPATRTRPDDAARERAKNLCPSFAPESVSGEELYWLAKLCWEEPPKALTAVQRYLAGSELSHGPEAHLLLAVLQMRATGSWEASWRTIRSILRDDPIGPAESQIDGAIDDEFTDHHPEKALEWSKERYEILRAREQTEQSDLPGVRSAMLSAGSDLVHRYYLNGQNDDAAKVLREMNSFAGTHPLEPRVWGVEDLHWANLEMRPAPPISPLKILGGASASNLLQPGRVQIISFFFLGCAPCMRELSELNELQKHYGTEKLRIGAVTTYGRNSYLRPPTQSNIEAALEKARRKDAPRIAFVMTSDETLVTYGVNGFPVLVIVDKQEKLRYTGRDINFADDDSLGILIHKLVQE
jgi:thiol-disulfide isomerase/thioredoxin